MGVVYGYCRISTAKQNIDRQVRNISREYPDANIRKETYTGTKVYERKEFNWILHRIKSGDTIVFDSVSRMSRNAEDGIKLYMELYEKGVDLVFLKEHHIDTATYKHALEHRIEMTGTDADLILEGVNKYLMRLAENQIRLAFDQSQKEVDDLRERTKEGIETARRNGKKVGGAGQKKNTRVTKKSIIMKERMKKLCVAFGGQLNDVDTMEMLGIARNTFYKYKRELIHELPTDE